VKNGKQVLQEGPLIKFGNLKIFIKKNCMVQPKYSPEEALQRVKLMMGYDLKKTLKENVKDTGVVLNEQGSIAKSALAGASTGAAAGAAVSLPLGGLLAIPGAVIGGVWGLVRGMQGSVTQDKFKTLVKACSTNKKEVGKITMDDASLDKLSDDLHTAFNDTTLGMPSTDEAKVKSVFSSIATIPDLCGLVDNYKESYGDLVKDLDGEMDGDEEWRDYVLLPLRTAIRATKTASSSTSDSTSGKQQQAPAIPTELKDIVGVRKFQDWLDTNKAGWATGFPDGKLSQAGGYGRFGPRTTKAWASYGPEYLKGGSTPAAEVGGEKNVVDANTDF
jgi:hypothetical protein